MNLELRRKVLEALGWTHTSNCPNHGGTQGECIWLDPQGFINTSSALETDSGLALDALVTFCDPREMMWFRIEWRQTLCRVEIGKPSEQWDGFGPTPALAICNAIIAASSAIKG